MASATKLMLWLVCLAVMLVVLVHHVDARCRGCTRNGRSKAKRGQETTETCNGPLCVRKCCPAGMHLDEYFECAPHEVGLWSPSTTFLKDRKDVEESKLQILFGFPPGCSFDDLVVVEKPFKLLPDGKMLVTAQNLSQPASGYCLENLQGEDGMIGVFCIEPLE